MRIDNIRVGSLVSFDIHDTVSYDLVRKVRYSYDSNQIEMPVYFFCISNPKLKHFFLESIKTYRMKVIVY